MHSLRAESELGARHKCRKGDYDRETVTSEQIESESVFVLDAHRISEVEITPSIHKCGNMNLCCLFRACNSPDKCRGQKMADFYR